MEALRWCCISPNSSSEILQKKGRGQRQPQGVHFHEIYRTKCSGARMKCRYFCTHTFLAFKNAAGRLPALNQTSNTWKVAADRGFQQLFNFNFTFKAPAGSLSSLTAQMHWRHFPLYTWSHLLTLMCINKSTNGLLSLPFFFHLH